MSTQFEPKKERSKDADAYESLASLLIYYIKNDITDMPQSAEKRLKELDENWAEQGEQ